MIVNDILLYANESPWPRAIGAALGGGLFSFILYVIINYKDKKNYQKQEAKYQKEKADAFIKSDLHGNGSYYNYLFDELIEKCNPNNFMYPYNYEKVKIANELYPILLKCKRNESEKLLKIRDEAINKLGINVTTNNIFDELCKMCNPQQFMSPYNSEKVAKANELYSRVLRNKNNIKTLEKIRDEARVLLSNNYSTTNSGANTYQSSNNNDFSAEMPIIIILIIAIVLVLLLFAVRSSS